MGKRKITGNWSLPGGSSYPGNLDLDSDSGKIILEHYSDCYLDGSIVLMMGDKVPDELPIIWGIGGNMGTITLYNCHWIGTSAIGDMLYLTKYSALYMFSGVHLNERPDFMIRSGSFSFPHLGSFYDGWQSLQMGVSSFDYNTIGQEIKQLLSINDELDLEFCYSIKEHIQEMMVSFSIEKHEYLNFNYKQDVPFFRLLNDAVLFRKLLSFSYGKPIKHKIHSIEINTDEIANSKELGLNEIPYLKVSVTNYTLNGNQQISRDTSHQNQMLISNWKMSKDELNSVIKCWFANLHLHNIYEYYLDSNNWFQGIKEAVLSNVMFNNRFLNLIQGLEDYFRETLESGKTKADRAQFELKKGSVLKLITDKELKKWLNDTFSPPQYHKLEEKLEVIVKDILPIINSVFIATDWSRFPTRAKDFRNQLSHGLNKNTDLGSELHLIYHMAQLLLSICILKSLKVGDIPKLIKLNTRTGNSVAEIYHRQN